jgi:hypothetical protein
MSHETVKPAFSIAVLERNRFSGQSKKNVEMDVHVFSLMLLGKLMCLSVNKNLIYPQ